MSQEEAALPEVELDETDALLGELEGLRAEREAAFLDGDVFETALAARCRCRNLRRR